MKRAFHFSLMIMIIALFGFASTGCSSTMNNSVTPSDTPDQSDASHHIWGTWNMDVDIDSQNVEISQDRDNAFHMDVIKYMPLPGVSINGFNPFTGILDVDVTLKNNQPIKVYDVRLILFTDSAGHTLTNADAWTPLYDIPEGNPLNINPFVAFGDIGPNSESTKQIKIKIPWFNFFLKFAVDASWPLHCEEPYAIENFVQSEWTESSSHCTVEPKAWLGNLAISSVKLICDEVTSEVSFDRDWTGPWELDLVNEKGAASGTYTGWIKAKTFLSFDLALYQPVEITIP